MAHLLIVGLLSVLPKPGEELDAERKKQWLDMLAMSLSFIYPTPNPQPPAAS